MLCHFKYGIFIFFSSWVLIMSLFVMFLLPETKNVPIEEMAERVWKKHWFWARFMDDHVSGPHLTISQSSGSPHDAQQPLDAPAASNASTGPIQQAQQVDIVHSDQLPPTLPPRSVSSVDSAIIITTTIDASSPPTEEAPHLPNPPSAPTAPSQLDSLLESDTSSAASSSPSPNSINSGEKSPPNSVSAAPVSPYETPSASDQSTFPRHIRFPSAPPPSSSFTPLLLNQIPYRSLSLDSAISPISFAPLDKADENIFEDADDSLSHGSEDVDGDGDPNFTNVSVMTLGPIEKEEDNKSGLTEQIKTRREQMQHGELEKKRQEDQDKAQPLDLRRINGGIK